MSKIIKCPICKKKKPVRNDAKVCSPACRVKAWRLKQNGMIMSEIKTMPVFNPFSGQLEDVICTFTAHYNRKYELIGVKLKQALSKSDIDLIGWFNEDRVEYIEQQYLESS